MSELLKLVNANDSLIGAISRHAAHSDSNLTHRGVYIFAQNPDNRIYLMRRSNDTDMYPCHYSVPGGHVSYHESETNAAIREIKEELGIIIAATDLAFRFKQYVHSDHESEYKYVFSIVLEQEPEIIKTNHEIQESNMCSLKKLERMLRTEPFTPGFRATYRQLLNKS